MSEWSCETHRCHLRHFIWAPALLAKAGVDRRLSIVSFGLAQVGMDIEPGIGMLRDAPVLHGWTHTIAGALAIAALVTAISPWFIRPVVARWNAEIRHYRLPWLSVDHRWQWSSVAAGAYFGTLSHVALDASIHADMHPLAPFATANPLLAVIEHDRVYSVCALAALIGSLFWLTRRWLGQRKEA